MNGTLALVVAVTMACIPSWGKANTQATTAFATESGSNSAATPDTPEMTSQDSAATFKVNVRLVEVNVVVRDATGKALGTLKKEDFKIFDDGKLQVISRFDVERPGQRVADAGKSSASSNSPANVTAGSSGLLALPEHYIAYLFDDLHVANFDLVRVREAAQKNLAALQATDRAAIFTTSGQNQLDFTDDQNKLRQALNNLRTRSISNDSTSQCPKMDYYLADLINNKNDERALAAVTLDALDCAFQGDAHFASAARSLAQQAASQGLITGETETRLALNTLKGVIRRLAAAPGQRSIILVSPGFITPQHEYEVDEIIDRAVRGNVSVNALDARGLYVLVPGGDASERGTHDPVEMEYQTYSALANADILAELADSTGGTFFHNNNDLVGCLRQLASTPEYSYVLGFSPQTLKNDGRFHKVKVVLNTNGKYSLRARRGYFAPKQLLDSEQSAKQEIEDAVFSQEEIHELPIDLHTQFFKATEAEAKLTVLAHVDVKQLHFQKVDGRNNDDLTMVSVIFDRNGNFVSGMQKILQLHLKDATLGNKLTSGLSLKSNFDLKPGGYLIRLVVRDAHGRMSAENGAVEIP